MARTGEVSDIAARTMRWLVQLESLFFIRRLFDSLEKGMAEELGWE